MLELFPHSAIAPEAVTENDIPQLRVGMYWKVQELPKRTSYIIEDMLGGNLTVKNSTSTIALINNILNAQSEIVEDAWCGAYKALYQVNNVYSVAERLQEGSTRNQILGEASYFRAYIYLQLVTRWGDVPLLTKNTLEDVPREAAANVWKQILADLDNAIELLGSNTDYYYVSEDAASALKARALLFLGRKEEAAEIADALISNSRYKLDSFDNIFRKSTNTETFFAFKCATADGSSIGLSNLFYSYKNLIARLGPVGRIINSAVNLAYSYMTGERASEWAIQVSRSGFQKVNRLVMMSFSISRGSMARPRSQSNSWRLTPLKTMRSPLIFMMPPSIRNSRKPMFCGMTSTSLPAASRTVKSAR